jgi:protein O-GlcNAc transferase
MTFAVMVPPGYDIDPARVEALLCQDATGGPWARAGRLFEDLIASGQQPAQTHDGYASVLWQQGKADEAIAHYLQALSHDPYRRTTRDSLIFALDCQPSTTIDDAWAARRAWWALHGATKPRRTHEGHDRTVDRPLRVGYVSGDFRHHSAGMAVQHLVCGHSEAVQAYTYATHAPQHDDAATAVYQAVTHYRDVHALEAGALADLVQADQIDILVDLSGYSAGNRLQAFCLKPAPVQVMAWGYPLGSGLDTMDAVFLDPVARGEDQMTEQVVELPSILPWAAPQDAPPVIARPDRAPMFGAFHRRCKLNADVLAVWAALLERVPDASIAFKGQEYADPDTQAWILASLPRAVFWPGTTHREHLAAYNDVDVVLEAWPQAGGVTTCEALYMGVPTVTLTGPRITNRVAASVLTNVGLEMCIATTPEDYIATAALLVTGRAQFDTWRPALRERLRTSPICTGYGAAVETAYRALWRAWCLKES